MNLNHLFTQIALKRQLSGNVVLEKRFNEINRVADVAWIDKKIVFEIQFSNIEEEEINSRERDYGLMGYTVIWILSDSFFNKKKLKPSEKRLRESLSFFTNSKIFYDQQEEFKEDKRILKGSRLIINFIPIPMSTFRTKKHSFYFEGDLVDLSLKNKLPKIRKKYSLYFLYQFYMRFLEFLLRKTL